MGLLLPFEMEFSDMGPLSDCYLERGSHRGLKLMVTHGDLEGSGTRACEQTRKEPEPHQHPLVARLLLLGKRSSSVREDLDAISN